MEIYAMGKITYFGLAVKKALLERGWSQREFCTRYGIPENRFCEMLRGIRPGYKYRSLVERVLQLEVPTSESRRGWDPNAFIGEQHACPGVFEGRGLARR
jgi:transcriptional regulator with XRE-family HTH domain